ncbi:MAG: TonB-dependent receptor [Candidatus Zixiibacteriota bacterium]|nr:MAG: TonB-dependent receptor [candidate division Zixibacteria bacterium]
MKNLIMTVIIMATVVPFLPAPCGAEQFGNVAVFLDGSVTEDFSNIAVQFEGEPRKTSFGSESRLILWNIPPGRYTLQLLFPDDRGAKDIQVDIFPGLTSKIVIEGNNDGYGLVDRGFADLAGHVLTLDRVGVNSFPGELGDGLSLLAGNTGADAVYFYDGLSVSESSQGRTFTPIGKTTADLALVNLSDPFAGYGDADVNLISNFSGPDKIGLESVYEMRDRRFHRIAVGRELPRAIGSLFGSVGFENLEDAAPRWNMDGRLPHNAAENVEFMGGAGIDIFTKFKADARMYYKTMKREYYRHSYHFDFNHSPREKLYTYKGRLSAYGWLTDDIFTHAGFGIEGDDSKIGGGVKFDNLPSYLDIWHGPPTDATDLFFSWDDIDGVTPDVDESYVFEEFARYKSKGFSLHAGANRRFDPSMIVSVDARYSSSSVRKYVNPLPTVSLSSADIIGFDTLAADLTDDGGTHGVPGPKNLTISLGAKRIVADYFLKLSVDYFMFDPDAMTLRNLEMPFGTPYALDSLDLTRASTKSKIGFRLAGGISISPQVTGFAGVCIEHSAPSYSLLYFNEDYLIDVINGGGQYIFPNTNLQLLKSQRYELGLSYRVRKDVVNLSYLHESQTNNVVTVKVPASPASYNTYISSGDDIKRSALILSYQKSDDGILNASIIGMLRWGDQIYEGEAYSNFTSYKCSGLISLQPKHLNIGRDHLIHKILSRTQLGASFVYRSGVRYTRATAEGEPLSLSSPSITPAGPAGGEKAKDFFEINLALTARVHEYKGALLSVKLEVLNILDRDNYLDVYPTSGLPDETGWLSTEMGETFAAAFPDPHDSSGLTGAEKYGLRQNDPNNFDRPRMFRVLARLEF